MLTHSHTKVALQIFLEGEMDEIQLSGVCAFVGSSTCSLKDLINPFRVVVAYVLDAISVPLSLTFRQSINITVLRWVCRARQRESYLQGVLMSMALTPPS